jgi:Ser-tRNA(Ala) deacylase AlaX
MAPAATALEMLTELILDLSRPAPSRKQQQHTPPPPTKTATKPDIAKAKAAAAPQARNAAAKAKDASPAVGPAPSAAAGSDLPPTEALYQQDTYRFTCEATVLAIEAPADEKSGWAVVLDSTCFHPQGGGQPSDSGSIGEAFTVLMVKKDPAGVVRHSGPSEPAFAVGAKVKCVVDGPSRLKNARVHSAGHLIDVAMTKAGMADKGLKPTKGYHFTPGSYVEYEGKLDAAERESLVPALQAQMDQLIAQRITTKVMDIDAQALDTVCPLNALPADRSLWGTGWVRVVCVGGLGCPCGGTNVRDTQELGKVKVEGVKVKGKVTRISYSLEEPVATGADID